MLSEVFPNIYLNEIPLPNNPLKSLNSYIFVSDKRNLIIDTGFNLQACQNAFMKGVKELNIDLSKTDLVLTHMHVDHSGLADDLRKSGCRVFISKLDGDILNSFRASTYTVIKKMNNALDLDQKGLTVNNKEFGNTSTEMLDYCPICEGNIFEVGSYVLEVTDIPGHTPGHIALYERKHKLLFSGDHILNEITPNITFWGYEIDSLGNYIDSLKRIYEFNIDLVFPAHRSIIKDYRKRIKELIVHHEDRLEEILQILREGKKTASQTAAKMHWDLSYDSWEDFPGAQKWFASGEAMSHLEHLVYKGTAQRIMDNETVYYQLL
ncbi:MBL fold metallo-hydrolase [Desulfotomaculum defluvii]